MSDDELSDLSSLSSLSPAPESDDELQLRPEKGILKFFHKVPKPKTTIKITNKGKATANSGSDASASAAATSKKKKKGGAASKKKAGAKNGEGGSDSDEAAPKRERAPSPPHEYVLADNQDIAFIVLFRNRFADAFPKNLSNFGPQDLESDIVDSVPSERVEHFLCALLKLLLNRQQDVKPGHYHRALEEAVQSNKSQWVAGWDESPLAGGKTFQAMTPTERLTLLRALVLWTMSSSKALRDIIDSSYKGKRKDDDSNIPVSIQAWGNDSDKRRYYLVEGRDDTAFRVYRESNPAALNNRTWWSVAGSIDEIKVLIEKLETKDGGPRARKLAKRLNEEIPRFEATEEKRRRREYRQQQRDRFKRPEPGVSLYEGRTRGKRIKYTYSDDEDFWTESSAGVRRSTRNTTGADTPTEPVTTASGRQIRAPSRLNGGLSAAASNQGDSELADGEGGEDSVAERELSLGPTGRPRRSAAVNHSTNGWSKQKEDTFEEYDSQADEEDEVSEPDLGDDENEDEAEHIPEDGEDADEEEFDESKDAMVLDPEEEADAKAGADNVIAKPLAKTTDNEAQPQRLSGASTPVNGGEVEGEGEGEGDVTMAGSINTQSSEATATSPAQQDARLADQPILKNATETTGEDEKPANGPTSDATDKNILGTPGKENGIPTAALAYRGSPEKTHQAKMPPIY
ncbi:hypothetical protein F503_04572 [Ophiostoma piceae UAMH 11346]|uniref:WHIM1 domain-containing protein n=1 Tax=Ophiostoma piceae (strain UAMH 11346) TaxID=1262450 RepID=S3D6F0_OPHP1|nr:hypothetical protein F503_04572 [Ophiostoma piceae UAMH 11346]